MLARGWRCRVAEMRREIASHTVRAGTVAVRLHGGPWDGKVVGVCDAGAPLVAVHGPRAGNHRVWITHVYERRGDRYEYLATEVIPLSAWAVGPLTP
jgi:hypothetical protein